MASITETNVYSPSITKVDVNNDVPNQQLANRTLYLNTLLNSLQTKVNTLSTSTSTDVTNIQRDILNLQTTVNNLSTMGGLANTAQILSDITRIDNDLTTIQATVLQHTHNYAGSAKPGGDAGSVSVVEDSISTLYLVGTNDLTPSKIRRNSNIMMENDVLIATTFKGDLDGIADTTKTLYNKPKITLSGDVLGSIEFTGEKDVVINTSLKEQSVSAGEYGTVGNYTLSAGGTFTVPDITVNSTGMITKIRNRTISLPSNMGINGITSSLPSEKKLYILGSSEQANKASVFTQDKVFIDEHHLYSNGYETINTTDTQSLKNKTYEGYELNDACARGVDEYIGGHTDDNRLVTSNSLARHRHNYALSDTIDGKALYVNLSTDNVNRKYLIGNNDTEGILTKNTNIYVQGKGLYSEDLTATNNMWIPGGKIWIESVEVPVDENAWSGNADIAADTSDYAHKTRIVQLANGVIAYEGDILVYQPNGYILADNSSIGLCDNVVLAVTDGLAGTVSVIDTGTYDLGTSANDGSNCYVGENGQIIFGMITTQNKYVKKIGYVENSYLVFKPSPSSFFIK